jgi:hypothetical protein
MLYFAYYVGHTYFSDGATFLGACLV